MKIEDQPSPQQRPDLTPCWELVIADVEREIKVQKREYGERWMSDVGTAVLADMRERDKVGRERYGTPLTAHNGRNQLVDAYQEALDCAVYLRAHLVENQHDLNAATAYEVSLSTIMMIRTLITERSRK